MPRKKNVGDSASASEKRKLGALPDTVRDTKKSSTPVTSDTTVEKGATDKNKSTTNRNLAQGKGKDSVHTVTSYFDPVWNSFSKHTDGSMQWIPKQIVAIGEDFLVWIVWFVSERFVNEIIMIIIKHLKKLDYQRAW